MSINPFHTRMVDLKSQYYKIKKEADKAILNILDETSFINGPAVKTFEKNLAEYLGVKHVIGCANGTDALQVALMALDLKPGTEIIVPSFTFIATAEVIALMGLIPVIVDVDMNNFNIIPNEIERAITSKTSAIMPVHLFGQCAPMKEILEIANQHGLKVIEDNAQSLGALYILSKDNYEMSGTMGDIGCTSFFPSKNLGAFGDGGAIFTNNDDLAEKMRHITNHGMTITYHHDFLGVNSRLDSVQAAVLNIKLKHLNDYNIARFKSALRYIQFLHNKKLPIQPPKLEKYSTHVFHQFTLKVDAKDRDALRKHLLANEIPNAIYYPIPMHRQKAFSQYLPTGKSLPNSDLLSEIVLSLPMHTELLMEEQEWIVEKIAEYYNKK